MDKKEITINDKKIYNGSIINLKVVNVRLPNGKTAKREIVEHMGAAAILPVTKDGKVIMVRQYRKPTEQELWEIPAGKMENGELPGACAARELEEETGYKGKLKKVFEFYTSPGFSNEYIYLYTATDLVSGKQNLDPDEILDIREFTKQELKDMISSKKLIDAKTLIGVEYLFTGWMES
jgi:ADP-ribose pyrophosphatase